MRVNNREKYYFLAKELDDILKDVDKYKAIYGITREEAEREVSGYTELKDMASLGGREARTLIINQYTKLMSAHLKIDEKGIHSLIDFENIFKNQIQVIFEMLLDRYDISELLDKYELVERVTQQNILDIAKENEEDLKEHFSSLTSKLKLLATIIYTREYGQDCVDTLQHHDINEIGIIDVDYIYIIYKGGKIHLEFLHFEDSSIILNIQKKTTQNSPANYDENNPTLVAAKFNSSRITVAGYGVTPGKNDYYYNERIFNLKNMKLEEMRDRFRTVNDLIYRFLILNQMGRGSSIISGSDMGVGKSTFLNALIEKIPNGWGIGIFDTQNELQSKIKYPWKNIYTVIECASRSIAALFAYLLKCARDILVVGEITMPAEVEELMKAALRLNCGVLGTLHSLSPFVVVENLRNLLMLTEMYNDARLAEADLARGLDLVIHLGKHPIDKKRIVVESIVEIVHIEQNIYVEPILKGKSQERISNLINMAQLALHKYLFGKSYRYNEIFRYDTESDHWIPVNLPTDTYFNKISKYVSNEEIHGFKENFKNEKAV